MESEIECWRGEDRRGEERTGEERREQDSTGQDRTGYISRVKIVTNGFSLRSYEKKDFFP